MSRHPAIWSSPAGIMTASKPILITPDNTLKAQYEFATADPIKYKHPAIIGGFGSGKTRSIPLRWLYLIDWRARYQGVACEVMIIEPTKEMIRDILLRELDMFFDSVGIKHTYHKTYHDYTIYYKGHKFVAMLRSSEVPESLTGKTRTDIIIDEFDKKHSVDKQRKIWSECLGRIRGVQYSTLAVVTTPEGYKLTYELWQENAKQNDSFLLIKARTKDNYFNPPDYYQAMFEQYDTLLQKQYLEGDFVELNGSRAYYPFDRNLHVKLCKDMDSFTLVNGVKRYDYPLWIGMDFNVEPMTATGGILIDGISYRTQEWWFDVGNTRLMVDAILSDYPDRKIIISPDMTGEHRETSATLSDVDILKKAGFEIKGCYFRTQRDRLNPVNNAIDKMRYFIDPSCKHLIENREKMKLENNVLSNGKNKLLGHITDADDYSVYQQQKEIRQVFIR